MIAVTNLSERDCQAIPFKREFWPLWESSMR